MKNTPKTDVVARQNTLRPSPFTVEHPEETPGPDAEAQLTEVSAEENEIAQQLEALNQRRAEAAQKRQQAEATARQEKVDQRAALLEDAADWREIARTSADEGRAKEYLRKARAAEAEATRLGVELNLIDPATVAEAEAKPAPRPISTGNAIWLIIGLFLAFLGATYLVGQPIAQDPMNAIGQSMLVNAPLRGLLAFTLTFATFLVSVFFIRFCFPQFYRIWHNRVDSERSLESLIHEAPAWVVLACLLGLFYTFMQVFASYYQALYA
ncbi:hypothetical protein ACAW74_04960 [Fibrella sp. WM1]|uniref:hypothetical protein n=1 Tax=Fibrella musci TaxID=3242485 RepID=UPI00352091FA